MILKMIEDDHQAARDLIGLIGNTEQQAFAARQDEFWRLHVLWQHHGVMVERAILPDLPESVDDPRLAEARRLQSDIERLALDLSRGQADPLRPWRDGLVHLREMLERQAALEDAAIVSRIAQAPPSRVAEMTAAAEGLRAERM